MKKTASGKTTRPAKRKEDSRGVDAYLRKVPEPARSTLQALRSTVRSLVPPGTTECISYRIPTFKYKGMLLSYAAFSNHCSLFPTSAPVAELKDELRDFKISKGTIQFPSDRPFPVPLLKKIVQLCIARNERQASRRAT